MLKKTTRGMTAGMTRRGVGFAVAGGAGYDTDAQAYITLVEAADTESLETGVKDAINAFVVGCKSDGIWDAIKAACIMAGARTLDGALVPLVGTAPQPYNFVSGDYNRKTGLVGDGATKYLNSNRAANAAPLNDCHLSLFFNTQGAINRFAIGVSDSGGDYSHILPNLAFRSRSNSVSVATYATGLAAISRSSSVSATYIAGSTTGTYPYASVAASSANYYVFAANSVGTGAILYASSRLSFYSIGESLDLALLDSRVSTLMTAIGAAIP